MLDKIQIVKPAEIEKRSMEIITSELNGRTWPEPEFSIVKRCIQGNFCERLYRRAGG